MNPADRLPAVPSDATIVHELGHVLVGFEIGADEQGIEFPTIVHDELARAWWAEGHATAWQRMTRGLAGMYFQALLEPQSLDVGFVADLLDGSLLDCEAPPMLDACMCEQGFHGDWERVKHAAADLDVMPATWMPNLRLAAEEMRSLVAARSLDQLAATMKEVIKTWLFTENEDAPFWAMILYPPKQLNQQWRAWP